MKNAFFLIGVLSLITAGFLIYRPLGFLFIGLLFIGFAVVLDQAERKDEAR